MHAALILIRLHVSSTSKPLKTDKSGVKSKLSQEIDLVNQKPSFSDKKRSLFDRNECLINRNWNYLLDFTLIRQIKTKAKRFMQHLLLKLPINRNGNVWHMNNDITKKRRIFSKRIYPNNCNKLGVL
jgi:hypothetical protein